MPPPLNQFLGILRLTGNFLHGIALNDIAVSHEISDFMGALPEIPQQAKPACGKVLQSKTLGRTDVRSRFASQVGDKNA